MPYGRVLHNVKPLITTYVHPEAWSTDCKLGIKGGRKLDKYSVPIQLVYPCIRLQVHANDQVLSKETVLANISDLIYTQGKCNDNSLKTTVTCLTQVVFVVKWLNKNTHLKHIVSVEWHFICRHGLNYDVFCIAV